MEQPLDPGVEIAPLPSRVVAALIDLTLIAALAALATTTFGPVAYVGVLALAWAYFAGCEASPWQATPGKRLMRLRVVGHHRQRISVHRTSLRFCVKAALVGVIALVLSVPFNLVHDLSDPGHHDTPGLLPGADIGSGSDAWAVALVLGPQVIAGLLLLFPAIGSWQRQTLHDQAARTFVVRPRPFRGEALSQVRITPDRPAGDPALTAAAPRPSRPEPPPSED